uniref:Uncharacterized protein n=1 Tax=Phlebotomus papatasi TaxID=29031 RepID=A0A1B0D293_PHLPP
MGKMFNLVMFLLGMLITMSAGGIMMGMWSVKLGMGVMLLNMAVLLIRLLLSGGNGNNGGGGFTAGFNGGGGGLNGGGFINGGGAGNGGFFNGGGGGNGFNGNGNGGGMVMLPQGRVNFQIFSSQSPVIATMPTMLMGNLNGNGLVTTLQTGTANGVNNDRVEFLGNLVGVAPLNQNLANILNQVNRKKK